MYTSERTCASPGPTCVLQYSKGHRYSSIRLMTPYIPLLTSGYFCSKTSDSAGVVLDKRACPEVTHVPHADGFGRNARSPRMSESTPRDTFFFTEKTKGNRSHIRIIVVASINLHHLHSGVPAAVVTVLRSTKQILRSIAIHKYRVVATRVLEDCS